jgi:hypothetical protein
MKFTADTTHKANAVPAAWAGRYVKITSVGGILHYGFSETSSAEIDRAVAATDAGASAKVGGYIADGGSDSRRIPRRSTLGATVYFCRESSAASTVYVELADKLATQTEQTGDQRPVQSP